MIDVYITETNAYNGYWLYRIFANGEKYTSFVSRPRLTFSEQGDIVVLYREALEHMEGASWEPIPASSE